MAKKGRKKNSQAERVQEWFKKSVTYEGEPYVVDAEQAEAIADASQNTIVVARAGSGKTRTIVAKIVYLVAKCGVKPSEIMAFVFNANAAREINMRLSKMCVDGVPVIEKAKIANTFHAFSRKIVYDACGGREKCGKILAGEKEEFVLAILKKMSREEKWQKKACMFSGVEEKMEREDIARLASMMTTFVNRAQQRFLGGEKTLAEVAWRYLQKVEIGVRERYFIELGVEVFRRYHWYLLNNKLRGYTEYGTDFNLIVSWAGTLIRDGKGKTLKILQDKKYILIDEYQDFSQLFLSVVMAIRGVVPDAKLFVVGDDWQAINRFAGSEVEYFKEFEKYFGKESRRLMISTNYRCNRAVVDMARKFMVKSMKEKGDFKAFSRKEGRVVLVNPDETSLDYGVVDYDKRVSAEDKIYMEITRRMLGRIPKKSTVKYIKTLVRLMREGSGREILILHRNNEMNLEDITLERLENGLKWGFKRLGIIYDEQTRVMTMHKSKGLEAEIVIILEADEGVIPKIHPDTELYGLFGETSGVALADQKRLFYVAMTRAKERLYIMHRGGRDGFVRYLGRGVERWGG